MVYCPWDSSPLTNDNVPEPSVPLCGEPEPVLYQVKVTVPVGVIVPIVGCTLALNVTAWL